MDVDLRYLLPERWRSGRHKSERVLRVDARPTVIGMVFTTRSGEWDVREIRDARRAPAAGAPVVGLSLVISGRCRMRDGYGALMDGAPGTCFQLDSLGDGSMGLAEWSEDFLEVSCYLHGHLGPRLRELGIIDPDWQRIARVRDPAVCVDASLRLHHDLIDRELDRGQLMRRLVAFIGILHDQLPWRAAVAEDELIAEACRILDRELDPGYSVSDLAAALAVNVNTLRRRFRRAVGMSPGDYQLQRRLSAARELLARHPVGEVASLLGYRDPAQFSRQFRRHFGATPSAVRREARLR